MTLGRPLSLPTVDRYELPVQATAAQWVGASSLSVNASITFPASPHTASGWVEVVSATTDRVTALLVRVEGSNLVSGGDSSTLVDIGVGGAGSETVLIPYLAAGYHIEGPAREFFVPVVVPVGSRLAVRCQSARTTGTMNVSLRGMNAPGHRQPPSAYPTTLAIGVNAAASRGTVLTEPGSANTMGAWTELTASCPQHLAGLVVQVQGAGHNAMHASGVMLDIGVGGAGSETVIVSNVAYYGNSNEAIYARQPVTFAVNIPAGSRIAARWQRQNANNKIDCHLLGIPA